MATKQHTDAMYYLFKELKSAKISLENAENRPGTIEADKRNIKEKIAVIEYLIDIAMKHM